MPAEWGFGLCLGYHRGKPSVNEILWNFGGISDKCISHFLLCLHLYFLNFHPFEGIFLLWWEGEEEKYVKGRVEGWGGGGIEGF